MTAAPVDAFGRRLHGPRTRSERIAALRRLIGTLTACDDPDARWLSDSLAAWARDGGSIEAALGVAGQPTLRTIVEREKRDAARTRFAAHFRSDAAAAAALRCASACPVALLAERDAVLALGGQGISARTLRRSRERVRRRGHVRGLADGRA